MGSLSRILADDPELTDGLSGERLEAADELIRLCDVRAFFHTGPDHGRGQRNHGGQFGNPSAECPGCGRVAGNHLRKVSRHRDRHIRDL